jgi:1-deoxy-D-xylulose-5-phosphate synthase
MRFVKPLDEELVLKLAETHRVLITIEENAVVGGAGSGVNELLNRRDFRIPTLNLGLPDRFLDQGSREELLAECGLDAAGIRSAIETFCRRHAPEEPRTKARANAEKRH